MQGSDDTVFLWTLRNGTDLIRCGLNGLGDWPELRLESTSSVEIRQRCSDRDVAEAMSSAWRAIFESRGWTEDVAPVRPVAKMDRRQPAAR